MDDKRRVKVIIGGQVYTIVGVESEEHIQKVAGYIDKKMAEVSSSDAAKELSFNKIATLTSINVADDYIKELQKNQTLYEALAQKENQLKDTEKKMNRLEEENIVLMDKIAELQLEVKRITQELNEYIVTFDKDAGYQGGNKKNQKQQKK